MSEAQRKSDFKTTVNYLHRISTEKRILKPRKSPLSVLIAEDIVTKIKCYATSKGTTSSFLVQSLLEAYLKEVFINDPEFKLFWKKVEKRRKINNAL